MKVLVIHLSINSPMKSVTFEIIYQFSYLFIFEISHIVLVHFYIHVSTFEFSGFYLYLSFYLFTFEISGIFIHSFIYSFTWHILMTQLSMHLLLIFFPSISFNNAFIYISTFEINGTLSISLSTYSTLK